MKYRWYEPDDKFHYLMDWDDLCVGYVAKKDLGYFVKVNSPYKHGILTEVVFEKLFPFEEMDFDRGHALVEEISRMEGWEW